MPRAEATLHTAFEDQVVVMRSAQFFVRAANMAKRRLGHQCGFMKSGENELELAWIRY
jgi:hypothetical protein